MKGFDYRQSAAHFVTLVSQGRECLFGEILDGTMHLNVTGEIVQSAWLGLRSRFPGIELDEFVVMPNHFHAIIVAAQPDPPVGATLVVAHDGLAAQNDSTPGSQGRDKPCPYCESGIGGCDRRVSNPFRLMKSSWPCGAATCHHSPEKSGSAIIMNTSSVTIRSGSASPNILARIPRTGQRMPKTPQISMGFYWVRIPEGYPSPFGRTLRIGLRTLQALLPGPREMFILRDLNRNRDGPLAFTARIAFERGADRDQVISRFDLCSA